MNTELSEGTVQLMTNLSHMLLTDLTLILTLTPPQCMWPAPFSDCGIQLSIFVNIYLIRLHIENSEKYLYFRKKPTFIRTRYRQNQHLW